MSKINAIERCSESQYRVVITSENRIATFLFDVDENNGLNVVTWDKQFEELMWKTVAKIQPILAAVLAFHQAQTSVVDLEIPDEKD